MYFRRFSMHLQQVFSEADEIVIYRDGENVVYGSGDGQFKNICAEWDDMLKGSVVMPAFGVSINSYTVNAMKSGVWVEFGFSRSREINGMPFEKLLVEVKPSHMGFNVNRYMSECGCAGRCFYIDLRGGNMSAFSDFLAKF